MLSYDIIQDLMATAAAKNAAAPREMSFKGAVQALTSFRETLRTADPERRAQFWEAMFGAIGHGNIGNRPRRVEPRAKRRRPKQYGLMNRPRAELRRRLLAAA